MNWLNRISPHRSVRQRLSGPEFTLIKRATALIALGLAMLCLQACGDATTPSEDIVPPVTHIEPAGGIYATWPTQLTLSSEPGATIHYHWEGEEAQQYLAPLSIPTNDKHQRLTVWATDATGNRESMRREHYIRRPSVPDVEFLSLQPTELGSHDSITLRWRSSTPDATYEVAVTPGDWGSGKLLANGDITTDQEQQATLNASDLYSGPNRLWLRVTTPDGKVASTSRWLTAHTSAPHTQSLPPGGVFGTAQMVSLLSERPATIHYTTDDSSPTEASTTYASPFAINTTTTVRFFSIDPHGNQSPIQETTFTIQPQAVTLTLMAPLPSTIGTDAPLTFSWKSDLDGSYDVVLHHPLKNWDRTLLQGVMEKDKVITTTIARNFLSPGDWQLQLQAKPTVGQPGKLILPIRIVYLEPFADTRFLNPEPTTAAWDTAQQHTALSRGPRSLSMVKTRGRGRRVALKGPYAYLANSRGGLTIVDTSEPEQPRQVGRFYPHGKAVALATFQHHVYMAASGSGLTIFDVTDPSTPRFVSAQPIRGSASDITINPPFAYVGTKSGQLVIFDLTTPQHPKRLGQVDTGGRVVDIAVHNDVAYIACLDQGLVIVDVHDPAQPRRMHQWPTRHAATGVAVHAPYVLIAAGELEVLDITQPNAPTHVITHFLRSAYGVTVRPPFAIASSGTDGLQIVKIQERSPIISSTTSHYAARLAFAESGDRALVADTKGGARLFDFSNPERPQARLKLEEIGTIVDVAIDGQHAYLANDQTGNGLIVVDLSQPETLRIVGWYHSEMTTDVAVWDQWALLSDAAGLLHLLQNGPPARPQLRDTLMLTGRPQRLLIKPPYAFVASDNAGLHVVEIAADGQLHHRSTLPLPGRALDLALADNTLYVAAGEGGIQVVDIATPDKPVVTASYHHPDGDGDHLIRLSLSSQDLFAIDNKRGIQILSHPTGAPLTLKKSFDVPKGAPWGLTSTGPYLFITTLLHSLYAYEVTPSSDVNLLSTAPFGGSALITDDERLYIAVRGSRGVPGGLRVIQTFAQVGDENAKRLKTQGIGLLTHAPSGTQRVHRAYTYHTPSEVESMVFTIPEAPIHAARLQVQDFWGPHGRIAYELSNNGGSQWHPVQPGSWFTFPTSGADTRWRATLSTSDILQTPVIESIIIETKTEAVPTP